MVRTAHPTGLPVQLTAGDSFPGRDPALDAVFRLIRESEAEAPTLSR
jgi:hypothetical protein